MLTRLGVVATFGLAVCIVASPAARGQQAEPPSAAKQDEKAQADDARTQSKANNAHRWTVDVVFAADEKFNDEVKVACEDLQSDKLQDCFAKQMKKANALPAAPAFSKQLGEPGYVHDFRAAGPVDIAYVTYPYRANENESCLIVNGEPQMVDVDNHKIVAADALKHNAAYAALAMRHKEVSLWPGDRYGAETPDIEVAASAGVHIIVNYKLREQRHACAVLGHAWYAFDFDPKGKFGGAKLLAVTTTPAKETLYRDATKPVTTTVGNEVMIALPVKAGSKSEWTLAQALDTRRLRLVEHTRVAPPRKTGVEGEHELWRFAAMGAGTAQIEFQRPGEKNVKFRVVIRGAAVAAKAKN